MNIVHF